MRFFSFVPLVAVFLVLSGCVSTPSSKPSGDSQAEQKTLREDRMAEAQMLKDQRRYLEAAAIYEGLLKSEPKNGNLIARKLIC